MTTDADLRYTFSCPSCAESFSITIAKIPPVQARFSCPKCGKAMDFPSRDEARVYVLLQSGQLPPEESEPVPFAAPPEPVVPPPPPAPAKPTPPVAPALEKMDATGTEAGKVYRVEKQGFENDEFDRRAMRTLIRTAALNEGDMIAVGSAEPVRADTLPELKSLFELRKTARTMPPPVCRKHIDRVAHYKCGDTGRPLCDECAEEKKFGGTSVRVCAHCGGTAGELHEAPGDME